MCVFALLPTTWKTLLINVSLAASLATLTTIVGTVCFVAPLTLILMETLKLKFVSIHAYEVSSLTIQLIFVCRSALPPQITTETL